MQVPLMALVLGVLIPVSGFIAWAGDRIGHQVGKRRHTLLGLRPRHTAMLFTVGSGIGISIVSFLLLWVSSEGFRVILSQGAQLLTANKSLRTENKKLTSEVGEREAQTRTARNATEEALRDRNSAQRLRDEALHQSILAQAELRKAQSGLQSARQSLTTAQVAYQETRGKLNVTAERLESARTRLIAAQANVASALVRVSVAETAKHRLERESRDARTAALKAEANRQEIEANADRTLRQAGLLLKEQAEKAEQQRLAFQKEVDTKQAELKRLQLEVDTLQARREELASQLGASISRTTALRRSQITYRVGEEIARISISSDQSIWRIESALERFWSETAQKAAERGATPATVGKGHAIVLSPHITGNTTGAPGDSSTTLPNEDEALRVLAQTIRRSEEPVAVVLVASANAVVGEPILTEIQTYRNPVVLKSDTKLGETVINGTSEMTREEASDFMYDFLRRDIRKALLDAGIIPTVSGDSEEGNSVVTLSGSEWLKIMEDLKRANFHARIVVKTAKPLRAADHVSLSFEIKSIPGIPSRFDFPQTGSLPPNENVRP